MTTQEKRESISTGPREQEQQQQQQQQQQSIRNNNNDIFPGVRGHRCVSAPIPSLQECMIFHTHYNYFFQECMVFTLHFCFIERQQQQHPSGLHRSRTFEPFVPSHWHAWDDRSVLGVRAFSPLANLSLSTYEMARTVTSRRAPAPVHF